VQDTTPVLETGPPGAELARYMQSSGGVVRDPVSGYLQFIRHRVLVRIAAQADAVIALSYRPGHFLVQGHPFATVWPPAAAPRVTDALGRGHITGPNRTLTQDSVLAHNAERRAQAQLDWRQLEPWRGTIPAYRIAPVANDRTDRLSFTEAFGRRPSILLARPDSYLGFAGGRHATGDLAGWLSRWFPAERAGRAPSEVSAIVA
jgi:Predicted membrane protein (DUF2254)